ncbi:unnamed protein product [Lepeophtheirus salmonis]|uniref:(salmon louse) hypothetical protein n=1 Tax=Lepeophtheirus salmonis TaxID=72036 RepID=A0A7R8HBA6_LEPSM|nr:unnamed protein product [Lepeophtheirus salmonis]CAF2978572.1 unnamed protein product [Lepeophtheirus salmonis]
MTRRVRQKEVKHPYNPTSLENLFIPPAYLRTHVRDNLLIWDSNYSNTLCRSLLFGTPSNLRHGLQDTSNWILDGTFKKCLWRKFTAQDLAPEYWVVNYEIPSRLWVPFLSPLLAKWIDLGGFSIQICPDIWKLSLDILKILGFGPLQTNLYSASHPGISTMHVTLESHEPITSWKASIMVFSR